MLTKADYSAHYYTDGGERGGYDDYARTAPPRARQFAEDICALIGSVSGLTVLDVGCGWGFLVEELLSRGARAYGIERSDYAISRVAPPLLHRVFHGDASQEQDFLYAKLMAGVDEFDLIVELDVLPCLEDWEAREFLRLSLAHGRRVIHRFDNGPHTARWYNCKPVDSWRALSGGGRREMWI